MTLVWGQRTDDGDIEVMVNRVAVMHDRERPGTDGLATNAEEGTVARSQITVDDPDGTFSIRGHRRMLATETEAVDDDWDGVVWFGFSYTQTVEEGEPFDGIGRIWTIDLDDLNTAFERRIMEDDANRPAETDVERIQWVLTTSEAGLIDDDTYVSTDAPVDMDAVDYRGQKLRDVFDDCAQQSGKNWYLIKKGSAIGGGGDVLFSPWYGHGTLDTFVSGVTISNDQGDVDADVDGLTFLPAQGDTKLRRDPSRVFSKVRMEYDGGYVVADRPATATAFALAGRDTTAQAMNVKTAPKALARANRYLGSVKTQEDVIETAIVVPAAKVNCVVHGHQVNVKVSWMPDYNVLTTGRVLNRTVRQIGEGVYELALQIAVEPPPEPSCSLDYPFTTSRTFAILGSGLSDAEGLVRYTVASDTPDIEPMPDFAGGFGFPQYAIDGADYAGDCTNSAIMFFLVGGGTLLFHAAGGGDSRAMRARVIHRVGLFWTTDEEYLFDSDDGDQTFVVPDDAGCEHIIEIQDDFTDCGTAWGWSGAVWTSNHEP